MPAEPRHDELPDQLADQAAELLIAVTEEERGPVLEALIREHPGHRQGLQRLCDELASADRLLAGTWPDAGNASHIGGHRVLQKLGEGAFGIVFLCAQEQPVVRQVAIKVLRPGAGDDRTLRRFAAERQLLAQLNHPAITQVYDAGALPDGRPYFVMEYVAGTPLRRFCDDHGLDCRARLRLFAELCHGVAHAHKRGIVHRDLKPQNVLVVASDRGPMPKIIDFGIAKALFASEGFDGPRTDAGRVIGTPGYMSPEQVAGRTDEIDERADVFALGVMLYELLTGQLPWAQGAAATDTEPVRPSVRVTTSTASVPPALSPRRQLAAELRGDLDWITLRALARERGERYQSVTALCEDVERHLRGEAVSVGPPSLRYRLGKFVRRNRALVATLGGTAVLLCVGAAIAFTYGRSADAAAAASEASATAMADRLVARANDPAMRDAPRSDAARQALIQDALSFYQRLLQERPADAVLRVRRCYALVALSEVHWLTGLLGRAGEIAQEAQLELEQLLTADPKNLEVRGLLGEALRKQGRALILASNSAGARAKFTAAASELEACAGRDPRRYGRTHAAALREAAGAIPLHLKQDRAAALRSCLEVLESLMRQHPDLEGLPGDHAIVCIGLAESLAAMGQLEAAGALLARAEADLPKVTAQRAYLAFQVANQRAQVVWEGGDKPAAIASLKDAIAIATAWQRDQPQRLRPQQVLVQTTSRLGYWQHFADDFVASSTTFRSAIGLAETMRQQFPDNAGCVVDLCRKLREFARTLWDRFRFEELAEARDCAARAIAVNELIPPEADTSRQPRWQLLAMQAGITASLGEDASTLWQQVAEALPADPQQRAKEAQALLIEAFTGVASWHTGAGRPEAATAVLAVARERIAATRPQNDKSMVEVGWLEARLAVARSDHAEAAAAAARIETARNTWFGWRRAADCLYLAWQCARTLPEVAAGVADGYRDRSGQLYLKVIDDLRDDVAKHPGDPWYVLPWGFASVGLAATLDATDAVRARELLDAALPKLSAVRKSAHADQWDEQRFRDGQALLQKLAANGR